MLPLDFRFVKTFFFVSLLKQNESESIIESSKKHFSELVPVIASDGADYDHDDDDDVDVDDDVAEDKTRLQVNQAELNGFDKLPALLR